MRSAMSVDSGKWHRPLLLLAAAAVLGGCVAVGAAPGAPVEVDELAPVQQAVASSASGPATPGQRGGGAQAQTAASRAVSRASELAALKRELASYLEQQEGTYGVYVVDLTTNRAVSINGTQTFYSASTIKLPLALYVLDQVARGEARLDEVLTYTEADWEDGTGILQESVEGDNYALRELLNLAITYSDNIATRMLLRRFGTENVLAHMKQLGGRVATLEDDTFVTTPRDMALYMRALATGSAVKDKELQQFLLKALEETVFTDRVAAGVPDGVPVAHKIGTLPGVVNDVGLVELPDHPFIVSVFSDGVDEEAAAEVIAGVTRMVYDYLKKS